MTASRRARLVSFVLRHTFKPMLARAKDAQHARAILNGGSLGTLLARAGTGQSPGAGGMRGQATPSTTGRPDGWSGIGLGTVKPVPATVGGISGEWVESATASKGVLLYLHGGGYFACSAQTHRPFTTGLARRGFDVFAPNYRLAPENPFPAAVMDAVSAYRALMPNVIAGDSAGGGLAVATLVKLRDEGDRLPAAAALFSPLTDLAGTGRSRQTNDKRCAMFHGRGLKRAAEFYLCGADPRDPLASPLYADLKGLPPLLIHVGADETLLDDSSMLAARACAAGVAVELKVWPGVPHVWQMFPLFLPEARRSLDEAAEFLSRAVAHPKEAGQQQAG